MDDVDVRYRETRMAVQGAQDSLVVFRCCFWGGTRLQFAYCVGVRSLNVEDARMLRVLFGGDVEKHVLEVP